MLCNANFPKVGEVWLGEVNNAIGSQQGGMRPFLIVSNDAFNEFSPTVHALPITSNIENDSPVHVKIQAGEIAGIPLDSVIRVESGWYLNKFQLVKRLGIANHRITSEVADCLIWQYQFIGDRIWELCKSNAANKRMAVA